jgi:transcription elongation factor SPT5
VPAEDLEAVPAQKNSSVIILSGELKGSTGKLIGIDGRDGIVKMDLNSDIKIVDMPLLAVHVKKD